MPIQLEVKRKLCTRTDRVKCVQFHPTEPWILSSLYNGCAQLYNFESQVNVKTFEITNVPIRAGIFVVRKNWVVFGSDDMQVRVYNFNTMEKIKEFEAHSDYLRSIIAHPTQPLLLTSSDDMTIKMWDWDNKWILKQTFEGHIHYVMQIDLNPRDFNTFASASMDRTVKIWQLGFSHANFTLEGHQRGVNCISYFASGDRPYLISGGDDNVIKIWDYQNKSCVHTINAHYQNINFVISHPTLPLFISGSEDSTVKCWHSNTYRLENMQNYGLERCWTGCVRAGSNEVAFGYDLGTVVVTMGRERPAASMDKTGKVIFAKHSDIQHTTTTGIGTNIPDGGRLPVSIKELGSCEIFPNSVVHSPNGRFIAVCGDGEYIIYTSVALRNKAYGQAQNFAWSYDPAFYATRDGNEIKVFKNFKELLKIRANHSACALYGGRLLSVQTKDSLVFYDWETGTLVCRVEISPKLVSWNDDGDQVILSSEEDGCFFVLQLDLDKLEQACSSANLNQLDVIEVKDEVQDGITSGIWFQDVFIYTTNAQKLNYYIGGHTINIAHLEKNAYVIGFSATDNRVLLIDRDLHISIRHLDKCILDYQSAIIEKQFNDAEKLSPFIPKEFRTKMAQFLVKQNLHEIAIKMATDISQKFKIAKTLKNLDLLVELAKQLCSEHRWKQVAKEALILGRLDIVQQSLYAANDLPGLLLFAKSTGNLEIMQSVADLALKRKKYNIAFLSYFTMGDAKSCLHVLLDSKRLADAALFCYVYLPSCLDETVKKWRASIPIKRIAQLIPSPSEYPNLFPNFDKLLEAEIKRDDALSESLISFENGSGSSDTTIVSTTNDSTTIDASTDDFSTRQYSSLLNDDDDECQEFGSENDFESLRSESVDHLDSVENLSE
ncbi:hypothetical protein GJ496_004769 [Pomphorhynchus laevis]|nr:hypothetical protein GJ496_004769 [Pomphorhynchus laevis]